MLNVALLPFGRWTAATTAAGQARRIGSRCRRRRCGPESGRLLRLIAHVAREERGVEHRAERALRLAAPLRLEREQDHVSAIAFHVEGRREAADILWTAEEAGTQHG